MKILSCIVLLISTLHLSAQPPSGSLKNLKKKAVSDSLNHRPVALQLHLGTQGIGGDIHYGFNERWSAKTGLSSTLSLKVNNVVNVPGLDANNSLSARFTNAHLLASYYPFKHKRIALSGGLAYLFQANGMAKFEPKGNYSFDEMTLTGEEVGQLDINFSWKGLAPYLGVSLLNNFSKQRFNVNLDLGMYYMNAPKSTVTGTKLLIDNYKLEPQFDQNMKNYRFLPVIQVNFNFMLSKNTTVHL